MARGDWQDRRFAEEQALVNFEQNQRVQDLKREADIYRAQLRAQRRHETGTEQYKENMGKFFIPEINTLRAHMEYVNDDNHAVGFSPKTYKYFDLVISEAYHNEFFGKEVSPKAPGYKRYMEWEGLRDNIAAIRNFVFTRFFEDGSFDPADQAKVPMLVDMAAEIGKMLQRDSIFKRPLSDSVSVEVAKVPYHGAQLIYEKLLQIQNRKSILKPWTFLGFPNKKWGLPPLEKSPFASQNWGLESESLMGQVPMDQQDLAKSTAMALSIAAEAVETRSCNLRAVDTLATPVLDESVELAREILEKMKIRFGDQGVDALMKMDPDEGLQQAEALTQALSTYQDYLTVAQRSQPDILNNSRVIEANEAASKLAYLLKLKALDALRAEGKDIAAAQLEENIKNLVPDAWKDVKGISIKELLQKIEAGMEVAEQSAATALQQQQQMQEQVPQVDLSAMKTKQVPQVQAQAAAQNTQKINTALRMDDAAMAAAHKKSAAAAKKMANDPARYEALQKLAKAGKLSAKDMDFIRNAAPVKIATPVPVKPTMLDENMQQQQAALLDPQRRR